MDLPQGLESKAPGQERKLLTFMAVLRSASSWDRKAVQGV